MTDLTRILRQMRRAARLTLVSLTLVFTTAHPTIAAADLSTTSQFDIPPQVLADAIVRFSEQSGVQVTSPAEVLEGRATAGVVGAFPARRALEKLLAGTRLGYVVIGSNTVTIHAQAESSGDSRERTPAAPASPAGPAAQNADELRPIVVDLPEVLIQGSLALNMDIPRSRDDAQPFVILDRETIEKSGSQTLQDFLQTKLTSNAVPGYPATGTVGENRSLINLRGLGTAQTLILIDGHRIASYNAGAVAQPDVNGIPLASIERIEVLPTTASGIYGGSATGGVVNIILRRDYSGIETKLTYGGSFDGGAGNRRVDFSAGTSLNDGATNLLFSGSYSDASDLLARQRDFLSNGRAQVLANDPDAYYANFAPPLGRTTNIVSIFGDPLTLRPEYGGRPVGSTLTSVPVGYAGPASDAGAGLVANAGVYNLEAANTAQPGGGLRQSLFSNPTVKSARASVQHRFGDAARAFLDVSHANNSARSVINNTSASFFVPAGAAGNPFEQSLFVTTPALGADGLARSENSDTRAVGGVILALAHGWQLEMDYTWSKSHNASVGPAAGFTSDASAAINSGSLDLFRDTNQFPASFAPYLGFGNVTYPSDTIMRDVSLRLAGALPWSLPGGTPTTTALLERRKESLSDYRTQAQADSISVGYARAQTADSAYFETALPLVGERNARAGISGLELTLSARWENYTLHATNSVQYNPATPPTAPPERSEDEFSSTNYTAALKYEPVRGLAFRGSYGTGFLPPALHQLVPSAALTLPAGAIFGTTDPLRGNELLGLVSISGSGNPDLAPEESTSTSFGIVFQPRFMPGLRASFDWVRIRKRNNITQFTPYQDSIDNEALLPGVITRGPPSDGFAVGPIIAFNAQFLNMTGQIVEAYDLALDYRLENVLGGTLTFAGTATRSLTNEQEIVPTLPGIEYVDSPGYSKWLANGTVTYELGQWTAAWTTRYTDGYRLRFDGSFVSVQGSSAIESQLYHDVSVRYRTGRDAPFALFTNSEIQLAVRNVFNTEPPFHGFSPYYAPDGDPRLATYSLSIQKSFY